MHKLHELKKQIIEELEARAEKGISSMNELKEIDYLAHAGKNLGKLIEMCEEEEKGGSSFRGMTYRGGRSYEDRPRVGGYIDNAYRRSRDSMGRYSREGEGNAYENGYAEASAEMNNILDSMLRDARSDNERKTIRQMMDELKVRD